MDFYDKLKESTAYKYGTTESLKKIWKEMPCIIPYPKIMQYNNSDYIYAYCLSQNVCIWISLNGNLQYLRDFIVTDREREMFNTTFYNIMVDFDGVERKNRR